MVLGSKGTVELVFTDRFTLVQPIPSVEQSDHTCRVVYHPYVIRDMDLVEFHSIALQITLPKTKMDTQNDGFEKVVPWKHGNFLYLC